MDDIVVCAIGGARRRRGFEPRFVRPSKGVLARPPPLPFSASPSTAGTSDGWVACFVFVVFTFISAQPRPQSRQQSAQKNKPPSTVNLQQCPLTPVKPADGSRISSLSLFGGGFQPAFSWQQLAAQQLRHAAIIQGQCFHQANVYI